MTLELRYLLSFIMALMFIPWQKKPDKISTNHEQGAQNSQESDCRQSWAGLENISLNILF